MWNRPEDIRCPNCGEETYSHFERCHHCGKEIPREIRTYEGSGCFIATASYGTPFAKEIDVLRQWRDKSLMTNLFGKVFVKFYYVVSPTIAHFISKSEKLKEVVRSVLNPFVKHLKNQITSR